MEHAPTPPPFVVQIVPYFLIVVPVLVMMFFLARRKGKPFWPYLLLGLIPVANMLAALWLASQTDAAVRAQLDELQKRVNENA
jgi:hypothetical protein